MIYLDNGATSLQKPRTVGHAMCHALRHNASPGRGGYRAAMDAAAAVYDCRALAAELFDCEAEQVVFTMNATHGLNLAIKSLVPVGGTALVSGFEHNAVMRPLAALNAQVKIAGRTLFTPEDTVGAFARAITPETDAVICTHVSNVFGYRLPVEEIAALCAERGVPFVLDASQSAGCLPISARQLDAAFVAMPGHKGLMGPQGTGILICRHAAQPLLEGGTGSQSALAEMPDFLPDRLEAGTLNVPGICGLRAGLRFVADYTPEAIGLREQALTAEAAERLAKIPGVRCFAAENGTQTGVLSFQISDRDCEQVAEALGCAGFALRAGLHCAPLAHESVGTLERGTVRLSTGVFNTLREIKRFTKAVERLNQGK
jgi:cysteine desulfurase family protein